LEKFDIVVLGPLADESTIRDGMVQRVAQIDALLKDMRRIYITISYKRYFWGKHAPIKVIDNLYRLDIHILKLHRFILNSKKIYVHSLHNVLRSMPWILFSKAKIFYDVHGIVPEEQWYSKRYLRSIILTFCEYSFLKLKKNFNIIYVTETMRKYIREKHKFIAKDFVIPIFPKNLSNLNLNENDVAMLKNRYIINDDDTVFIYSGSASKWQKIDLMLSQIKKLSKNNRHKFFILTGDYDKFDKLLSDYGLKLKNVFLNSVSPEELAPYYAASHYGFLLRDRHPLNNVACPTKAVEYLTFGIIPIVLEHIGDLKRLGYEYISINDITEQDILSPRKSDKNVEIAQYLKQDTEVNLHKLKEELSLYL